LSENGSTPLTSANGLLQELRERSDMVSPAERRIAEYIIDNSDSFVDLPMKQLADAADVSEATLIRFCRRRGFEGLPDFRIALAKELAIERAFLREPTELADPLNAHIDTLAGAAFNSITAAKSAISPDNLQQAARLLLMARRIEIVGMGGASANTAAEAVNRLFRLGLAARHTPDGYQQRMIAATLGEQDVMLIISASGELGLVLDSARIAKEGGAKLIAITRPSSQLESLVDIALTFEMRELANLLTPSSSRYGHLFVLDMLATAVAHTIGPDVVRRLLRVKETISGVITDSRNTPIGD
jgi:DNA-binding MurR/RpiR family transcriptional regulator